MNLADNEGNRASDRKEPPVWATILILIGVFALLVNFNIIPGLNWDIFWPVLLIVVGILGFYEYYHRK